MSWAEFLIRSIGFKRARDYEQMLFREVAYSAFVSGWMGKTKPPSKQKFWPIGSDQAGPNKAQLEKLKEVREAIKQRKNGNT